MTMKTATNKIKGLKLKIQFAQETRFVVPTRQTIRSWTQMLAAISLTMRELALAEPPQPIRRKRD